jgi:hypothetical protein
MLTVEPGSKDVRAVSSIHRLSGYGPWQADGSARETEGLTTSLLLTTLSFATILHGRSGLNAPHRRSRAEEVPCIESDKSYLTPTAQPR